MYQTAIKQITFISLLESLISLWIPPVNTVPHSVQFESLRAKSLGLELSQIPYITEDCAQVLHVWNMTSLQTKMFCNNLKPFYNYCLLLLETRIISFNPLSLHWSCPLFLGPDKNPHMKAFSYWPGFSQTFTTRYTLLSGLNCPPLTACCRNKHQNHWPACGSQSRPRRRWGARRCRTRGPAGRRGCWRGWQRWSPWSTAPGSARRTS